MRIGVYICECGVNIGATVDVEKVAEYAKSLPNVTVSRYYKYMCSDPGQELIKKDIKEFRLDRVVVASCSPRMHEPTFRNVLKETGLNPYCFEMANIREQCSWVHENREKATEKATALVASAVLRAPLLEPLEKKKVDVTPNALVIGGGIAGIQAALDIGDMGYKTYLIEKEPSIGGRMAQLDKTFPTLDCSACILTPKMVDVPRNKNIELLTYSEVTGVEGYVGNFKVKVRKKPRYVDMEKCTGCGECVESCSVNVTDEFNMGQGQRKAIYIPFPQAVPQKYTIDKIGVSPCVNACPAGVNAQGYIALISQGKFKEALELIRERNPFPGICGRICTHLCEQNCNRKDVDEPVAIQSLKRFLVDYEMKNNKDEYPPEPVINENNKKDKVAIIGSGPSGLTVGYYLAKLGYRPTVFEALPEPGGMLKVGVPEYRLPKEVLDYDIKMIEKEGVEIRTNTPIGPDLRLYDLIKAGYRSIYIAIGAHKSRRLGIEGEDLEGVYHGASFLHDVRAGTELTFKDKMVAVIGGGNVAMDSVRTAIRLGAKTAFVIYRRTRKEIPASPKELEECAAEGVSFYYLSAPLRIIGKKGKVAGIECIKMKLGEPDESGRRKTVPIEGAKFTLLADIVINAVGQIPELLSLSEVAEEIRITKEGMIPVKGLKLDGVHGFTDFLHAVSIGKKVEIGRVVLVIGGGNVAVDVARSAIRLGAKEVHVACVESREEMPAFDYEIKHAEEEGAIIHVSKIPKRFISVGKKAVGVEFLECISVFDSDGRFNPKAKEGTESVIMGDTIFVAIGQEADYSMLMAAQGFLAIKKGVLQVDPVTFETNIPGVFAGGDVIGEGGTVIDAIAHAHEAVISIDRHLSGKRLRPGREKIEIPVAEKPEREIALVPRVQMPELSVKKRIKSFEEIEQGFAEEMAIKEAQRCMNCNVCSMCKQCIEACEADAILHEQKEEEIELDVGAIVVATGYDLFDPKLKPEYGYGKYDNVITALEFERLVSASGPTGGKIGINGKTPKKVVFIQCVGSRDKKGNGNEYCSRVCCMYTAKQAHLVKEKIPNAELTVFYTDMRAFGKGFEEFYNRVQGEGVVYKRREIDDRIEVVKKGDRVVVKAKGYPDTVADLVVLATGIIPRKDTKELVRMLNINQSADGFLLEAHPKLKPIDTFTDGVFLAGCCQGPKDIPDTVAQASGAAVRASIPLSQGKVVVEAISAVINDDLCSGCRICEGLCIYSALEFDPEKKVMKINDVMCKGCGACGSACPSDAISMNHFNNRQILAQIGAMMG